MDWIKFPDKIKIFCRNYRYVFLVFAIGVLLMCLPKASEKDDDASINVQMQSITTATIEEQMEQILAKISGAGKVSVMLTDRSGEETVYQTDRQESISAENQSVKTETVVTGNGSSERTYLIRQVNPPKYLGAVVVCQGADDPKIRLAIVDAVSKLTGLGANCISVLKMK